MDEFRMTMRRYMHCGIRNKVKGIVFIIIIKRLCCHTICQMNAIAITMQAKNRGCGKLSHDQSGYTSLKMCVFRSFLKMKNVFAVRQLQRERIPNGWSSSSQFRSLKTGGRVRK